MLRFGKGINTVLGFNDDQCVDFLQAMRFAFCLGNEPRGYVIVSTDVGDFCRACSYGLEKFLINGVAVTKSAYQKRCREIYPREVDAYCFLNHKNLYTLPPYTKKLPFGEVSFDPKAYWWSVDGYSLLSREMYENGEGYKHLEYAERANLSQAEVFRKNFVLALNTHETHFADAPMVCSNVHRYVSLSKQKSLAEYLCGHYNHQIILLDDDNRFARYFSPRTATAIKLR